MALSFSTHLRPRLTVFDCMDELSAFKNAPQEMKDREAELLQLRRSRIHGRTKPV